MRRQIFIFSFLQGLLAFCYNGLAQFVPGYIPGTAESAGLTHVVPDVPIWYNGSALPGHVSLGPIPNPQVNQLADQPTWEPWVSVIGEKVFVIECNKYADDGLLANQRYVLAFQPARTGTWADAKLGECFYDDYNKPYTNSISSRQNGNPGRVYGDRRYDGTNFVAGGEADPQDHLDVFSLDGRFDYTNFLYWAYGGERCALVQTFSLDMSTYKQTPLCKAFNNGAYGHPDWWANPSGAADTQYGRFGGGMAALDNGNFAVVNNDRSNFFPGGNPGNETVCTVVSPNGSVVAAAFLVNGCEAWTDPCGFKGGFCVRSCDQLFFYDNSANLITNIAPNDYSGVFQATGRGDGDKICGDIRNPYVFYASGPWVTAWNATNGAFLGKYQYNDDMDPNNTVDRADVACDSLGNVCVAWDGLPTTAFGLGTNFDQTFANNQIFARVFHFNGSNSMTPLTHTFFAFINHDGDTNAVAGYKMENSNLDMTTKYICIAGKGLINSTNNVAGGPDSQPQTTVYTVISNPGWSNPVLRPAATLTGTATNGNFTISWPAYSGDGTLQSTPTLKPAAWVNLTPQPASVLVGGSPYQKTVTMGTKPAYFRLAP